MKIFNFLTGKSKIFVLGVIVIVLLTSTVGVISGDEPEENKELLDCLCRCLEPPGGQFSCCYNTVDRGWSPSCRDLSNGPCICKAYGCFRAPLPTEGECYDKCYAQYAQLKPEEEEGEENHPPTVTLSYSPKYPVAGDTIYFTAKAKDIDGDPLTYEWYVKDVKQKNSATARVGWDRPRAGSYTSKVIVSDDKGETAEDSVSFTVAPYEVYLEVIAGEVTVNGRQVKEGDKYPLGQRDEIETSYWRDPGCAVVRYADGTQLRVMPGTRFMFFKRRIFINEGGAWVECVKRGRGFIANTPFTIIGVKGTEFEVRVKDDGITTVNVFEGVVEVSDTDMRKTVSVNAGETTTCEPYGVPSDPEPFDSGSLDRWWEGFSGGPTIGQTVDVNEDALTDADGSIVMTDVTGLTFESRSKSSGSTVQIPLTLKGIEDKIGNMDITLGYDPSVLEATEVIKGGLTTNSLFEYNLIDRSTIKISLADKAGFSGEGSIAYVKFNVIGYEGSVSPLEIVSLSANRAEDMASLSISTQDGFFTVLGFAEGKGDCDGDGEITAADALCALQMAVGKRAEELVMDVNEDGKVSSLDAREILKIAIGKE